VAIEENNRIQIQKAESGEIGKRLSKPNSPYKELNGISAVQYLNKAKTMFEKMNLQWDLEQLEHVIAGRH
jgi:hypothetical protein